MELAVPHGLGHRHSERFPGWITLSALAHLLVFSAGGQVGLLTTPTSTLPPSPAPLVAYLRPVAPVVEVEPEKVQTPPDEGSKTRVVPAESAPAVPALSEPKPDQEAPTIEPPPGAAVESSFPWDIYLTTAEVDVGAEPSNEVFLAYPWMAYAQRLGGKVTVALFISEHGDLEQVSVVDADPPGIFEAAALEAVNKLRFTPARKNGRDVKSRKTIEVVFDPSEHLNHPAQR